MYSDIYVYRVSVLGLGSDRKTSHSLAGYVGWNEIKLTKTQKHTHFIMTGKSTDVRDSDISEPRVNIQLRKNVLHFAI